MSHKKVNDEQLTETQVVEPAYAQVDTSTWKPDFHLREADYIHLMNGKPITHNIAITVAHASLGYLMALAAKGVNNFDSITKGEWIVSGACVLICLFLFSVGYFVEDNSKKVMKKMKKHFEEAPTRKQAFFEEQG